MLISQYQLYGGLYLLPLDTLLGLLISGVVFKILVALIDTPLLYLSVNWIRSYYKLGINEEIKL